MLTGSKKLKGKFCEQGKQQAGFTLVEMLVSLAIISFLAISAQTLSRLSFVHLHYLTRKENQQEDRMLMSWQWFENDILQIRGDLPWHMDGTLDANSCLVSWRFNTENKAALVTGDPLTVEVRYRVEKQNLIREEMKNEAVLTSQVLLSGIDCLHVRFWQRKSWHDRLLPKKMIQALSFTLHWQGVTVERVWPVVLYS